ncbi:MAG TPA: 30S ribosomal protein S17 [Phycisphaerae bacterium]|nr:30S ribosomal protein S17 [Phycisphaerae bacterium]
MEGNATSSEGKRRKRSTRIGVVASDKADKTIRVVVAYSRKHPLYGKYVRRRTVLHVHDAKNEARNGDRVEVMACRPMSKTKHWRLVRVMEHQVRGK